MDERLSKNAPNGTRRRLIVGISGASGSILGIRLLEAIAARPDVETHLIVSATARIVIARETDYLVDQVEALADHVHAPDDLTAPVASGSFAPDRDMIVIPCSIKTLSAVANSYAADLMSRAADVTLKEGGRLALLVRESPLHLGHLRLMTRAAEMGAIIIPPIPAFYGRPQTLSGVVGAIVGRALARLDVANDLYPRWRG
jgi:4-hydroxy-3-polyprenylbenzoate decarboxylase